MREGAGFFRKLVQKRQVVQESGLRLKDYTARQDPFNMVLNLGQFPK